MPLVRRLALLVALEGVALLVVGVVYVLVSSSEDDKGPVYAAAGAAVLTGAVLLLLARGVWRSRGWTRSPVITLNVFPLPIAFSAFQAGAWPVGLVLAALGGTALYLSFTPDVREALSDQG